MGTWGVPQPHLSLGTIVEMKFPAVDPIPIPAPIWLIKLLSYVTLALHFAAVMILVGSLLLVCVHNFRGKLKKDADLLSASFVIARRLPVLMTFVINLGVPPLLFAQVLYGRAIYSSSVLIGVMWFSVILLLMLDYWLLYRLSGAIEGGRSGWQLALIALLVTMGIGQIYTMNMTLMLRPEVWRDMYLQSPSGLQGPGNDPTMMPRWLFVMAGGLVFGGLWALMLSNMKHIGEAVPRILRRSGGALAATGALAQLFFAYRTLQAQPQAVLDGIKGSVVHSTGGYLFAVAIVLTLLLVALQWATAKSNVLLAVIGLLAGFLSAAGAVVYRDGIRDFTLKAKGFDVWQRTEFSNWSVLGLFLLLFVVMLGVIVWLLLVMKRASAPKEQVSL